MKFIVSSNRLLKELQIANSVISSRVVMPILENFLFVLSKDQLSILASDLENAVHIKLEVSSEDSGSVCVPSKIFLEYLKNIENQPLTIHVSSDYMIEIVSDKGRYKLKGEDPSNFPKEPKHESADKIKISSSELLEGIEKTIFAVSQDDVRLALTGILFEVTPKRLRLVSTDAHRLVYFDAGSASIPDLNLKAILPKKASTIIKNFLGDNEQTENEIGFTNNHLFLKHNNIQLASRLIDAEFPDYTGVIPQHNPYSLTINKDELLSAVVRLNVFSNRSTNMVIFNLEGNKVTISSHDTDYDREGKEEIVSEYQGENLQIAFNGRFLTEMLRSVNKEQVIIKLSAPQKPAVIFGINDKHETLQEHLLLIMPLIV